MKSSGPQSEQKPLFSRCSKCFPNTSPVIRNSDQYVADRLNLAFRYQHLCSNQEWIQPSVKGLERISQCPIDITQDHHISATKKYQGTTINTSHSVMSLTVVS